MYMALLRLRRSKTRQTHPHKSPNLPPTLRLPTLLLYPSSSHHPPTNATMSEGTREENQPPPYENGTASTNGSGTNGVPGSVSIPALSPEGLLEPSLKLDFSTIENNLHKSDQSFAREVVKLIAERAENGIFARDCWGYKFLDPPVLSLLQPSLHLF